jgi:hypothetical protein
MARPLAKDRTAAQLRTAEMQRLAASGLSQRAIARLLGVSVATVCRALRVEHSNGRAFERSNAGTPEHSHGRTIKRRGGAEDGYPEALRRHVPCDFVAILPPGHYRALVRAAAGSRSAAAAESLRQALLLHGEPLIPPPTSIELALSEEEEEELGRHGVAVTPREGTPIAALELTRFSQSSSLAPSME